MSSMAAGEGNIQYPDELTPLFINHLNKIDITNLSISVKKRIRHHINFH